MADISQAEKVRATLAWYQAMGVDEAVADAPLDWTDARFAFPRPPQKSPAQASADNGSGGLAHISTLENLRDAVAAFEGCGLKRTAKSLCFARGNPEARVMLVGTNVVYWRPPGNRNPSPQEVEACRPFLTRQLELVAPEIMVLLGGAAGKHILGVNDGIMKLRGKWHDVRIAEHQCRALATLHPAYLLRNPLGKRLAWRDLLMIRDALDGRK